MSTVFHLMRHADHGHVGRILTGRTAGVHLSAAGRMQARALARHMASVGLDALFSSPRLRARETAAFIARETGTEAHVSPSLDEIDFGRWSGTTFEALARDPDWMRWNAHRDTAATPAGETMNSTATRVSLFLDRLRDAFPGGSIGLVSHSDVIKACICRHLGQSFQKVHAFEISPASITTLVCGDRGIAVSSINECKRIAGPMLQPKPDTAHEETPGR